MLALRAGSFAQRGPAFFVPAKLSPSPSNQNGSTLVLPY
jgi:hypothetical protein